MRRKYRNPGARAATLIAPGKTSQRRYKMGFALVRCQSYVNIGSSRRAYWQYETSSQLPKGTANRQIQGLLKSGWKMKVTY